MFVPSDSVFWHSWLLFLWWVPKCTWHDTELWVTSEDLWCPVEEWIEDQWMKPYSALFGVSLKGEDHPPWPSAIIRHPSSHDSSTFGGGMTPSAVRLSASVVIETHHVFIEKLGLSSIRQQHPRPSPDKIDQMYGMKCMKWFWRHLGWLSDVLRVKS